MATAVEAERGIASGGTGSAPRVRELAQRLGADTGARFVIAGVVNTGLTFCCFVVFQHSVGSRFGYMWTLVLTHATSVLFGFCVHRVFVFRVRGNVWSDLWRYECVYLVAFGLNAALLPLCVELAAMPVVLAQGLIMATSVVVSWVGHSRFSFRRGADA